LFSLDVSVLRLLLCLLALLALTGCPGGGTLLDSLDYPQIEPNAEDLVGLYRPTAATLKEIRERGHYAERDISITLSANGTFTCTNIPDWWMAGFGKPSGGFTTRTGSWKPIRQQQWWVVGLDFSSPTHFNSPNTSITLVGAKSPYALRIILGDSDQGAAMDFTKHEVTPHS
jgi:hypothetical protein